MQFYDSNEYRATNQWPYAIAAGCAIYRTSEGVPEVLLVKRNAGHPNDPNQTETTYNLPKGHVAIGEALEQTAQREAEEETGTRVEIQTYLGANTYEFTHPGLDMFNSKTTHYFAAKWLADETEMDSEHDGKEWLSLDRAISLLEAPTVKRGEAKIIRALKDYMEHTVS